MTELSTLRPPLPSRWVTEIFKRMQGRYGSQWVSKWATNEKGPTGDVGMQNALDTWADELSGFLDKPECIKYALEVWNGAFPPSLPEFRELCREYGRRKQQDALKLEHKLSPEEREQQRAMAEKVASSVKKPESFDDLAWAKKPKSQHAADAVRKEAAEGNQVMSEIYIGLIAEGICSAVGKLLKRWDGACFVKG